MLTTAISNYLKSHKRLVVPQLGAFLVKEPDGIVVFSELLKRDDGALRELLVAEGRSDLEAAGEIDRLVFEVRHAVERGVGYPLEGLGILKPGPNGTIAFAYDPTIGMPATESALPEPEEPTAAHVRPEKVAEAMRNAFDGRVSPSVKRNPDPSVKGLRYGKPAKTTDAYTYVDSRPRRRKLDRFVLVAIVATLLAVAAIAFGFYRNAQDKQALEPTVSVQDTTEILPVQPQSNE